MLATLESTIMTICLIVNRSVWYVDYVLVYAVPVTVGSIWIWRGAADGVEGIKDLRRWMATR